MQNKYTIDYHQDVNQQYIQYADSVLATIAMDDSAATCIKTLCKRIKEIGDVLEQYQDLDAMLCK